MKIYVAPKAAVLSMNVKENIAASSSDSLVTVNGYFRYNPHTGRIHESDYLYTGAPNYFVELFLWSMDPRVPTAEKEAVLGCAITTPSDAN